MTRSCRGLLALFAALTLSASAVAQRDIRQEADSIAADNALLAARAAARAGDLDRLASLAPRIAGHVLEPYYEYWKVSLQVRTGQDGASAVHAFLQRYAGSYLGDRLLADWLLALGARGDYAAFDRQWREQALKQDNAQIDCYATLAEYALESGPQRDELAGRARRQLADTADTGGEGCTALAERLIDDGHLSVWVRLRALVGRGQMAAARSTLERLLNGATRSQLRRAFERPAQWLASGSGNSASASHEIAIIAVALLARQDPARAAAMAERLDPALSPQQRGALWSRLGEVATMALMPEAEDWFRRAGPELATEEGFSRPSETLEWRARAALRAPDGPDWSDLAGTLERMPADQRSEPAWVYWDGRVLIERSDFAGALQRFESIAGDFSFYRRLAAEEIGRPLELPPAPAPLTEEEIATTGARIGFARAVKLYSLGLREDANREWAWQLRDMSDRELRAAAEYARRRGLPDRMILTSGRTRTEIDLEQRYPTPYRAKLSELAQSQGIDQAWIYGLIRQESLFWEEESSSAGARGLMQLLPTTAGYVAQRIGLRDYRPSRIYETDMNLRLGVGYLKMVSDDQGGQPLLASAAYNAGPRRLRQWRGTLRAPIQGAVFVETIPFDETRDYVKRVLLNTMIYGALEGRLGMSLGPLLDAVSPDMPPDTDLP